MTMLKVDDENYRTIIDAPKGVLLVSASYCIPCRRYRPVLEEVANEMSDVVFGEVELDVGHLVNLKKALAGYFPGRTHLNAPETLIFRDSSMVYNLTGYRDETKEEIIRKLSKFL